MKWTTKIQSDVSTQIQCLVHRFTPHLPRFSILSLSFGISCYLVANLDLEHIVTHRVRFVPVKLTPKGNQPTSASAEGNVVTSKATQEIDTANQS
jgi:hypothetical protein